MSIDPNLATQSPGNGNRGFTLIEILIAIVLIGILSAVAVVGISSLVSKGTSSACNASKDAARSGATVYLAANANVYPTTFTQLTQTPLAAMTPPSGAVVAATTITSGSWTLTITPGVGTAAPTFVCT
jgi:prepilin-type N-terminal cleavage/methylation domain-containing protein